MQILIRRENFETERYELRLGDTALEFAGKNDAFSLAYSEIRDFSITQEKKDRTYFAAVSGSGMYEGEITDAHDVGAFIPALKEKMHGVVSVDIRI